MVMKDFRLITGDCGLAHMGLRGVAMPGVGYDLRNDHWGRGLATEAATAVRDDAFRSLQFPQVFSLIRQGNHASQLVAEQVSMSLVEAVHYGDERYWLFGINRPVLKCTEDIGDRQRCRVELGRRMAKKRTGDELAKQGQQEREEHPWCLIAARIFCRSLPSSTTLFR